MKSSAMLDGKSISNRQIEKRKPSSSLPVPIRDLAEGESLALGFRQSMISVGEGKKSGGVDTGAGCGTDYILLRWKDRTALVRGSDLFKAWVATFDKKSAERFSF